MRLRFTKHALLRLEERAITLLEIEEILGKEYEIFGRGACKVIRGETERGRFLDIVVDEKLECILTVHPTKKKYRRS
ncbi:DUF4258 domain-containing protein [Candidatus Saganbacteria bacterium]|nr:DUF4258 domain-containing protein [Candidatus Saganbacteria bacterium]